MLQDVPNFNYVYIHVGNDDDHTDGCLLVGDGVLSNLSTENNNLNTSAQAYERIYKQMSKSSSPIEIVISDEKEMLGYESC